MFEAVQFNMFEASLNIV